MKERALPNPKEPESPPIRVWQIISTLQAKLEECGCRKDPEEIKTISFNEELEEDRIGGLKKLFKNHQIPVEKTADEETYGSQNPSKEDDPTDIISEYSREIHSIPLLTKEGELLLGALTLLGRTFSENNHADLYQQLKIDPEEDPDLYRRLERKAGAARKWLALANTKLAVSLAKNLRDRGVPFEDLIQLANEGLMLAVDKYDFRKGVAFATYAYHWLERVPKSFLDKNGEGGVRIPIKNRKLIRTIRAVSQKLKQELGQTPTLEEIAEEIKEEPEKIRRILEDSYSILSLDEPVEEDQKTSLMTFIENRSAINPDQVAQRVDLSRITDELLETLTPQQEKIIRMRYGLSPYEHPFLLEEIGKRFSISKRVRQIQNAALRRLRQPQRAKPLKSYWQEMV